MFGGVAECFVGEAGGGVGYCMGSKFSLEVIYNGVQFVGGYAAVWQWYFGGFGGGNTLKANLQALLLDGLSPIRAYDEEPEFGSTN